MSMTQRRGADALLADLDAFVRAAKTPPPEQALPTAEDAAGIADPEAAKEEILAAVREALDWDGQSGDPNESLAALEDALADMFDCGVDITFDGESALMLHVEGEDPTQLTPDYLGQLLEELAKAGGGQSQGDEPEGDQAQEDDPDRDEAERGYMPGRQRNVVDKKGNLHDAGGEGGGQFVAKGGAAGGAAAGVAKKAAKAAGKAAGKPGGGKGNSGPSPSTLAGRAGGRAGPRATSRAVSGALTAGTGNRVKVSGNKDGSFNVGRDKKKMSGKKIAVIMFASWIAFGVAGGFLAATLGLPLGIGIAAASVAQVALLIKLLKAS